MPHYFHAQRMLAASIALALGSHATEARSATITVGSGCSLASAIISANEDMSPFGECGSGDGDDVIVIGQEVNLTADLPPIISNIDFVGDAVPPPGINGLGNRRLFFIGGDGFAPQVSFSNLLLEGGSAVGGDGAGGGGGGAGLGGAIFQYDGVVVLDGVRFETNEALGGFGSFIVGIASGGGGGGGLSASGGSGGNDGVGGVGNDGAFGTGGGGGGDANFDGGDGGGVGGGSGGVLAGAPAQDGNAFGFGAGGGAGASGVNGTGQDGANGAFCGGGGGGGGSFGGGDLPGTGGTGGFGGGGGSSGSGEGAAGQGGSGGFGGGGGAGGNSEVGAGTPGAGGDFAGSGAVNGIASGSGAGLGGAVFVRAGTLMIQRSTFTQNQARGGSDAEGVGPGEGRGGALFVVDSTSNVNGNLQGMPVTLPIVVAGCGNSFDSNLAEDDSGSDTDNDAVYGVSFLALSECLLRDSFED